MANILKLWPTGHLCQWLPGPSLQKLGDSHGGEKSKGGWPGIVECSTSNTWLFSTQDSIIEADGNCIDMMKCLGEFGTDYHNLIEFRLISWWGLKMTLVCLRVIFWRKHPVLWSMRWKAVGSQLVILLPFKRFLIAKSLCSEFIIYNHPGIHRLCPHVTIGLLRPRCAAGVCARDWGIMKWRFDTPKTGGEGFECAWKYQL